MKFSHFILIFIRICWATKSSVSVELASFVKANSAKPVTLMCPDPVLPVCRFLYQSLIKDVLVPTRLLIAGTIAPQWKRSDFIVLVCSGPQSKKLHDSLLLISKQKIKSSLLYLSKDLTQDDWDTLEEELSKLKKNTHFFIASGSSSQTPFFRVICLNDQSDCAINRVRFYHQDSFVVKESYDLQGMKIASITETWPPYLMFDDCDELGSCLTSYGLLWDLGQVLAWMFNFTLISDRQQDGNWGTLPDVGPYNLSGTWEGIFGKVLSGKYPLCLSGWFYYQERHDLLDFVSTYSDEMVLVLAAQSLHLDTGTLVRPFTSPAWFTTVGFVATFALFCLFLKWTQPKVQESDGFKIMTISIWYFYVLVSAYYSGALTMFFLAEDPIPFTSIRDVVKAYPEWNLIVREGECNLLSLSCQHILTQVTPDS